MRNRGGARAVRARVNNKLLVLFLFSLGVVAVGCSSMFVVHPGTPHPNVALVPQGKTLNFTVNPAIRERFDLHAAGSTFHVAAWRTTLANGFRNGLGGAFHTTTDPTADLVLQIDEATLEIGDFEPGRARVRWSATLRMRDGTLRRTAGVSGRPAPAFEGSVASVGELFARDVSASVDAMYEQIARDFFASPQGGSGLIP